VLQASLEQYLERKPDATVAVFRCGGWQGPAEIKVDARRCTIRWCPSALAVRESLAAEPAAAELTVILTDRTDDELGLDLLARLTHQRLLHINFWEALRQAFGATKLDPRLAQEEWLAEALLENLPAGGYPPVAAGTLNLEGAWATYLEHRLALPGGASDLATLLRWSTESSGSDRLRDLDADRAQQVLDHLRHDGGGAGAAVASLARAGSAEDAVPLGFLCRVLYAEDPETAVLRAAGTARLEELLGGESLSAADGRRWAEAAETLADQWRYEDRGRLRQSLKRADDLLDRLKAGELAHLSRWLTSGYRQRLARFAAALSAALESTPATVDSRLETAATAVESHQRGGERERSPERLPPETAMAVRLVRWLARQEADPTQAGSLPDAAILYAAELSFVDLARGVLWSQDPGAPLAEVYRNLLERVLAARERFNQRFGELVRSWFEADGEAPALVPVESVIERVVAPLASQVPVLLLVLDGLSFAVYHQLLVDLLERGWEPRIAEDEGDGDSPTIALAALPGITKVSRAALFSGRLEVGGQSLERRGFADHPALAAASPSNKPPLLFHKADLRGESGGSAAAVTEALADKRQKVVGIVINAVDDQLSRGDQLLPAWSVDTVRHLETILEAAEDSGRAVVLTADHGHLPEWAPELTSAKGAGERWRPADGEPAAGEVLMRGRRVIADGGALIVPWSETLRYQARKAGYHGGVSPQELLAPLTVLVPDGIDLPGWRHPPGTLPVWWEPRAAEVEAATVAEPRAPRRRRKALDPEPEAAPPAQGLLFAEVPTPSPERPAGAEGDPWTSLFSSPVWEAQVERAGGQAFARRERVVKVLGLIDRHGGRLSLDAASRALNLGLPRLRSIVTQLQRLLNVDAYPILDLDEVAGELRLDRALLDEQFELHRR
jgi:hypothetical protein